MKQVFVIILAALFLLNACSAATGIEISNPWARPAMKGSNGVVYFLLQNHSAGRDELTGVSSDVAEAVEIHESKMEGDVMQMQQVMSVPISGKASIEFAPGSFHVMLIGLKQELKAGDEIQVTLHFRNQKDIGLTLLVQEMEGDSPMDDH